MSAQETLQSAFQRSIPDDSRYTERVRQEFALIDRNGFTRVFLQAQVIIGLCQTLHIPHIIRGSAGSSLICYLMGISHTDPLKYDMDLARFMNHGRKDLPDIDIDVPYNRRDELYEAIGKQWPGMVARISNHVLYQYKSALQEAIRTFAPKVTYRKHIPLETLVPDPEVAVRIKYFVRQKTGSLRT
jgi:error-prone DNA polymerase